MNRTEQSQLNQQRRKLIFGLLALGIISGLGAAYEFGPNDYKSTIFIIAGTFSFVVGCLLIIFEYANGRLKKTYGPNPNDHCTLCCFNLLIYCGYRNMKECQNDKPTGPLKFDEVTEQSVQVCCEMFRT